MPTIDLPGQPAVFYLEYKADSTSYPPLVLVHGAGGSRHDWPVSLQQLPDAHVLTLDLPGHGESAGPGRRDTLDYARIVGDLLGTLNLARAIIAGHSMGGAIAQQMAHHMPEHTAGLILVGTGSKLPVEPTLTRRIIEEHEAAVDWLTAWSWAADVPVTLKDAGRQRLRAVAPEILQGDYIACQAFDGRSQLEQISVPVLVLGSDADRMMPLKFSVTLAERIPNARLVEIHGAGHNFPLERGGEVIGAIREWLDAGKWEL
ncbi:MAG: alpha/beta hydrolase [Chloroflexi bacterium]|nr:alpha/beta hydrolase [Chloroflexota bacterium]